MSARAPQAAVPATSQSATQSAGQSAGQSATQSAALSPAAAWHWLHEHATAPYRSAGRFAWHFARGKLGHDPVFRGMLERGDLQGATRVVDIGCGQGLMASLLQATAELQAAGHWPATWPPGPTPRTYLGVELMARDVHRAQAAVGALPLQPTFLCADMCEAALPPCDVVVILDVLHYVDHAAQAGVLQRVRDALRAGGQPGARLLLRVGDAASRRGFAVSQWVDRIVTNIRGHRVPPTWGRTLPEWMGVLIELGFQVQAVPMSQGTPFANVLLVAQLAPQQAERSA